MKQKLTLSIESDILAKAKKIAKAKNISVSSIFEKSIEQIDNPLSKELHPKINELRKLLHISGLKKTNSIHFSTK
jgi:Family of unknown function (DUF6364)